MINLLPPEQKEELLLEQKKRIIVILGILVLFFLFCLFLFSFLVKIYLQIQVISQKGFLKEAEKGSFQLEIQDLRRKIDLINQDITRLEQFYKNRIYFSEILDKISQTIPRGVYLTNFSAAVSFFEGESLIKISLSGFAPTREILLEFNKKLEEQINFKNISFPAANWVKPRDINFFVNFEYNL
ncbi:MAG: hypothetical protein FJZ07_00150 [Candidatus Nealsonbacteria bacterium]|nr:hypothetical protein [Candidatus Nealsonbacteria bacterium]